MEEEGEEENGRGHQGPLISFDCCLAQSRDARRLLAGVEVRPCQWREAQQGQRAVSLSRMTGTALVLTRILVAPSSVLASTRSNSSGSVWQW